MSDRGMKKWAPYKSLVEQGYSLNELSKNNKKVDKPKISLEMAEEINEVLCEYHGQEVVVGYYRRGEILEVITTLKKIDTIEKRLVLPDKSVIKFSELVYLRSYN